MTFSDTPSTLCGQESGNSLATAWERSRRWLIGALFLGSIFPPVILSTPAVAQTVLYDGKIDNPDHDPDDPTSPQFKDPLNYFSASHLTYELASPLLIAAGDDPNALEAGDGVWFRSSGRRMRGNVEDKGLASTAVGVDGSFMTAGTGTTDTLDVRGHGAGFVLYDDNVTTGMQNFNISLYYNDTTPNYDAAGEQIAGAESTGGNVAISVRGVKNIEGATDPWGGDAFTYLAGNGRSGGLLAAGNHQKNGGVDLGLVADRLFLGDSSFSPSSPDVILNPSADWQDLTFQFDAGDGYDFLIFSVGGVMMTDAVDPTIGPDRFAFDNISFEAAPVSGLVCDFDNNQICDEADIDALFGGLGGTDMAFDVNGDEVVDSDDITAWLTAASDPANPFTDGTKVFKSGDVDFNGVVDSSDLGRLLNNFGDSTGLLYGAGNLNGDANVDSSDLGGLLNNFGFTSPAAAAAQTAAVPEPGSLAMLLTAGLGMFGLLRRRNGRPTMNGSIN